MKLISYMVTCGGDAGWRFSNRPEWCSMEGMLLFDAEKWNVDSVARALNEIWLKYWHGPHGFTLSETLDNGYRCLIPFINDTDGVYVDLDFSGNFGWVKVNDNKKLHSNEHETERWSKDGKEYNPDYDKRNQ